MTITNPATIELTDPDGSAVTIFGPDLERRWSYQGRVLGDPPSVDELIQQTARTR